jgi:UDP-2,3-diacylglucosamine pyrophosphatase LpxH
MTIPPPLTSEPNGSSLPTAKGLLRCRAVWISDVHLGIRGSRAELLLEFLQSVETEQLYLVGDLIDGWQLRQRWYWPPAHQAVVHHILAAVRRGVSVRYLPGNHDEAAREFLGLTFAGVPIMNEYVHVTATGKKLLVLHGDQFDSVIGSAKWLAHIGDAAYNFLLGVNAVFNYGRRLLGLPYWSLSAYFKRRVKNAVQTISNFETVVTAAAKRAGADGVVCGHTHHAEMRMMGDVLYCNDGDWVESCTALLEHGDGRLQLLDWRQERAALGAAAA